MIDYKQRKANLNRRNALLGKAISQNNKDDFQEAVFEYAEDIFSSVANAINPINNISAPFIVAVLQVFIDNIIEASAPPKELIDSLTNLFKENYVAFRMPDFERKDKQ